MRGGTSIQLVTSSPKPELEIFQDDDLVIWYLLQGAQVPKYKVST